MLILNSIKTLEESEIFKNWKQKHDKFYICSVFLIMDHVNESPQIDYYDPDKDRITNFVIDKNIKITEDEKIFKKEKHKIKKLDLSKVKISLEQALSKVENLLIEKYKETAHRKIVVLQNLEREVWNITSLTTNLNILNVKIDATNGDIVEERLNSILSFKDKQNL